MQPSEPTAVVEATPEAVDRAVDILRRGGLVAFPTETVYGLGASASDPVAVGRIFAAKGRPADHPVIVHLPDVESLGRWAAEVPDPALALATAFWPGPLTLVVARSAHVSDAVTGGRSTVGLRVPDQPVARHLLRAFGDGIAAPSANRFGQVSPTTAQHVADDLGGEVDLILDGGPCRVGVESTIVEAVGRSMTILRPGAVTVEQVEAVVGQAVRSEPSGPARAPGMLASHYSPRARVIPVEGSDATAAVADLLGRGLRVAVLAERPLPGVDAAAIVLDPVGDVSGYARRLYERLRRADEVGADVLVAVLPAPDGLGVAVRDRLRRAAHRG